MTLRTITFGTLCVRRDRSTLAGAAAQPRRMALLALLARQSARPMNYWLHRSVLRRVLRSGYVTAAYGQPAMSLCD